MMITMMISIIAVGSALLIYGQKADSRSDEGRNAPPPPMDGRRPGPPPDIFTRLSLTDDQKTQIEAIRNNEREAGKDQIAAIRKADEQLRMMVDGGTFTVENAQPIIRAKANAQAELELIRLGSQASIQKILTQDQRTQLNDLRERRPPSPPGGEFGPPQF